MKLVIFFDLLFVGDCLLFFFLVDEIFVLLLGFETNKIKGLLLYVIIIID